MNARRGGYGNRQSIPHSMVSGNLMTSNLGLQDIDLELELLKRKREIIEQQQQMLINDYPSENRFAEYSHMYDNSSVSYGGGGGGGVAGNSRGRKRPNVWEHEVSQPKRFSAPSPPRNQRQFTNQRPQFRPKQNSQRGYQPRSQSGFKPNPKPPVNKKRADFKPTKVNKGPAPPPPAKLNSYPPAERKRLVEETVGSSPSPDSQVLRADRPPSSQVKGRLELALGNILKEMRDKHPEYADVFKNPRIVKQKLREQMHAALIGKHISHIGVTISDYRKSFPENTDKDLLNSVLQAQQNTEFSFHESDNPEEFFMQNLNTLMSIRMEEMFNKLCDMYGNTGIYQNRRNPSNKAYMRKSATNATTKATTETIAKTNSDNLTKTDTDNVTNTNIDNVTKTDTDNATNTDNEPVAKSDTDTAAKIDTDITAKIDADNATDKDADPAATKNADTAANVNTNPAVADKANTDTAANTSTDTKTMDDKETENDITEITTTDAESLTTEKSMLNSDKYKNIVSDEMYLKLHRLMSAKLPLMLRKLIPQILKTMKNDNTYRRIFTKIRTKTEKKMLGKQGFNQMKQAQNQLKQENVISEAETQENKKPKTQQSLLYYVKILGRPYLPNVKQMQAFLNQFNPRYIKKHRNLNVLFVGFNDKQDLDNILAANGSTVGKSKITIKISERSKPNQAGQNNDQNQNTQEVSPSAPDVAPIATEVAQSGGTMPTTDLDEQITDLLTSIRKSEELMENTALDMEVKAEESKTKTEENVEKPAEVTQTTEVKENATKSENIDQQDNANVEVKDTDQASVNVKVGNSDDKKADAIITEAANTENGDGKGEHDKKAEEGEKGDTVTELIEVKEVKGTPTRASARLASTPSAVRMRRASKLAE